MKKLLIVLLLCSATLVVRAQVETDFESFRQSALGDFSSFRDQTLQQYNNFRNQANAEYARLLKEAWQDMHAFDGEEPPERPEPPKPTIAPPTQVPTAVPLPIEEVEPQPMPAPQPEQPVVAAPMPASPVMDFYFYNTPCRVHAGMNLRFRLQSVDEDGVSNAWSLLSTDKYDGLLHDCLELRKQMQLCDWAYISLLRAMTIRLFDSETNEAVVMQAYLLAQSNMRVRLAKTNGRFVLLIPFDRDIYSYPYIPLDGLKYYVINKGNDKSYSVCNVSFPKEQVASIEMTQMPVLSKKTSKPRPFGSERYPNMNVSIDVNQNLIEFFSGYPLSDAWDCYARASLSTQVKNRLYPMLKANMAEASETEAVNMLLDFVQTAFQYKTDQDQFGYERPLFGDESFFYPYNDCEDRSIVFSILVRDLLGLDVVLLNYPNHLATAVRFNDEVRGDYVVVGGKKFVVCDPTYIGAGVGQSMPQYQKTSVKVVVL